MLLKVTPNSSIQNHSQDSRLPLSKGEVHFFVEILVDIDDEIVEDLNMFENLGLR